MIEDYSFGHITVDGGEYTHDLIIYPDRIDSGWWREQGHTLLKKDIGEVLEYHPEVLIVGTGANGRMRIRPETAEAIESVGIELIATDTGEAVKIYNRIKEDKRVVAALHLTC